ncbi:4-hydroxyphenylacetate 3-hydroxylase [Paenibacillus sp. FSL H8-0548]|uniref:4-hydroxyphenylacetate 3-hydroxylase family protein n=1 Tax=Paenibacillus sp. FSL H8-0548 TaxID=1920422 RepID=UPI00096C4B6F|nr:4-hydroxyphenylacetate 3-hydroxylase N-terminal domain-containing protein [Paenibacillus sp. FSL H8-0548]OMF20298.1 4-hydroxyphenylacetate 3-hydroxylase [Paenibacillus sp. FSL H8-0548]
MNHRGKRFVESLEDGRSVWLEGKKVEGLAQHAAFKGTLRTISGLFGMLDRPDEQEIIGYRTTEGHFAHSAFLVPYTAEELAKRTQAFHVWSKRTNGMMSRLSDYARSIITGWYGARVQLGRLDPHFESKISAYYREARDRDLFLTTAILDPQINRASGLEEERIAERFLHIVRKTEEGIVVRGAKMIATGAPYTHDFVIFSLLKFEQNQEDHAHVLIVPANSKGLHIVCRESYADDRPKEHILSSQYEEMDAVLFFDDVLIPWERVLLQGNVAAVQKLREYKGANSLAYHQTAVRSIAKFEFVTGVTMAIAESIGVKDYLHIQEKLGELLSQVDVIKALVIASESEAKLDESGMLVPEISYINTARNIGTKFYPRAIEIIQQVGGGGFVQTPSGMEDFYGPISKFMHLYFEGATVSAEKKVQLMKLAWDLVGSPLGSRHELYERFYAGDPIRHYAQQYQAANKAYFTDPVWKLIHEGGK